jgi:predicted patatin/cPLA2 family phospholipase
MGAHMATTVAPVLHHPVLEVIAARRERHARQSDDAGPGRWNDGARLALVIEGGGMRGAVSGGMALALHELALTPVFDAAYGSSAGALGSAWLLSGSAPAGLATYLDRGIVERIVSPRRALAGGPVVDTDHLLGVVYEQIAPGFFARVASHPVEIHPVATDVVTGAAVDLHATVTDGESLRRALRASAALPLLSGPAVPIGGRAHLDGGAADAIGFHAAIEDGATHLLVLRSRRPGDRTRPPGRVSRAIVGPRLRRIGPAVERAWATRAEREGRDEDLLDRHDADTALTPAMLSIRTPADAPTVSRLERDTAKIGLALEAGRAAGHLALAATRRPAA